MTQKKDWKQWHGNYNDPESSQAQRLTLVRQAISRSLPDNSISRYQIIDICAGDGRDLLPELAIHPNRDNIFSYLVELDYDLAAEAVKKADKHDLNNVTVVVDDASQPSVYSEVIPADLILLCGVFGNITPENITHIIETLPQLSKANTRIIWTQNLRNPELTTKTRELFQANHFKEVSFETTSDNSYGIGIHTYIGEAVPLNTDDKLFTFIK